MSPDRDCFVALLLAMTASQRVIASEAKQSPSIEIRDRIYENDYLVKRLVDLTVNRP